jgi:prepilin-type N-terminal cleavage/methylation domain-containing protein
MCECYRQQGFSLLEVLVALILFSIIIIGSSKVIGHMMYAQKDMHVHGIVIDQLQARIQGVVSTANNTDVCSAINKEPFDVDNAEYFIGCSTNKILIDEHAIDWPVLAASSKGKSTAESCAATKQAGSDCYIVGN